ncbi:MULTISPECIES: hypothetical protein [Microbacterium]|uniref:hypothetical protein n=1 Tax=Microbacterium TaxID=33882 RepID=UPI00278AF7A6|nr:MULTISPECIES: hypothetical protein [Microbacterium]MDQ1082309.1 hypothetical protein [Microbacterium sp. SORGH_AS_0344]MDQ1168920.1 hypothetical protein [Microbacterium proteolyticum]
MITTTPVRDDIRAFAAAVRAHLDDLPSDDVDDLLDGLEADLSDQAAEAGDAFELPDATTYAEELRAAAGLPERSVRTGGKRTPVLQIVRDGWRETGSFVRRSPAGAWLLDLSTSLRPLWWVLRAVVLYLFIAPFLWSGYGWMTGPVAHLIGAVQFPGIVLMTALLLVSVQWGRGRWAPNAIVRGLRTTATVFALLLAPFTVAGLGSSLQNMVWASSNDSMAAPPSTPGLSVDGERIRNIYAFDADGNPIPAVQLFDQDGDPLTTVGRDGGTQRSDSYFSGGGGPVPVPYVIPGGTDAWNVFPLREIPAGEQTWDEAYDLRNATLLPFPFDRVQPLPSAAAPTASATPTAEPSPTAEPTPTTVPGTATP